MDIQIINTTGKNIYQTETMVVSRLCAPRSLDEFDINIIDFSEESLWVHREPNKTNINDINDLVSLHGMIERCNKAIILFVFPQNIEFKYAYHSSEGKYSRKCYLKDIIRELKDILSVAYPKIKHFQLAYENTHSTVIDELIPASFHFNQVEGLILSDKSGKQVLFFDGKHYFTTLQLSTESRINVVIKKLGLKQDKDSPPVWFSDISMFDDEKQKRTIIDCNKEIDEKKQIIESATESLERNNRFKSILYSSGDELVEVVFEILEDMLGIDLSSFVDVKNEDFCFPLNNMVFIGEIKGVSDNVKRIHVSQLDDHVQGYLDDNPDARAEDIVALLIINHQRTKAPIDREPINKEQIHKAEHNGSLIVETNVLLEIYEKYRNHSLSREEVINSLIMQKGIYRASL